jgi:hypothetical protein
MQEVFARSVCYDDEVARSDERRLFPDGGASTALRGQDDE